MWLDEGLAEYVAYSLPPFEMEKSYLGFGDMYFREAINNNELIDWDILFRTDRRYFLSLPEKERSYKFRLAYSQCFTFVKFLIDTYGIEKLFNLLEIFSHNDNLKEVFEIVYEEGFEKIEKKWFELQKAHLSSKMKAGWQTTPF